MNADHSFAEVPEIVLPEGGRHVVEDGPTWFLTLPDGRELRLMEPFEGEFTIERCDAPDDSDAPEGPGLASKPPTASVPEVGNVNAVPDSIAAVLKEVFGRIREQHREAFWLGST